MNRATNTILVAAGVALIGAVLVLDLPPRQGAQRDAPGAHSVPLVVDSGMRETIPVLRPYLGKPTPPVQVRALEASGLHAGVPSSIRLEIIAEADVRAVVLRLDAAQGLELGPAGVQAIGPVRRGRPQSVAVGITPLSGGPQRLMGSVEYELDGQRMTAPVSLTLRVAGPVTVFPVASKPEAAPQPDATGELVYPLAAN